MPCSLSSSFLETKKKLLAPCTHACLLVHPPMCGVISRFRRQLLGCFTKKTLDTQKMLLQHPNNLSNKTMKYHNYVQSWDSIGKIFKTNCLVYHWYYFVILWSIFSSWLLASVWLHTYLLAHTRNVLSPHINFIEGILKQKINNNKIKKFWKDPVSDTSNTLVTCPSKYACMVFS